MDILCASPGAGLSSQKAKTPFLSHTSPQLLLRPFPSILGLPVMDSRLYVVVYECATRAVRLQLPHVSRGARSDFRCLLAHLLNLNICVLNSCCSSGEHFSMCLTESPSSFYGDEMLRSLTEQSFGLEASAILETTQLQATASVTLLEGQKIKIKLTMRGYSVR